MYKMIEVVGTSPDSFDAAVKSAVEAASAEGLKVSWFEVKEMRGGYHNQKLEYQVKVVLGVKVDKLC